MQQQQFEKHQTKGRCSNLPGNLGEQHLRIRKLLLQMHAHARMEKQPSDLIVDCPGLGSRPFFTDTPPMNHHDAPNIRATMTSARAKRLVEWNT